MSGAAPEELRQPGSAATDRVASAAPGAVRWSRLVAMGDSLTEGMCDTSRQAPGEYLGWADRLALLLAGAEAGRSEPLRYANLAVRSRRIRDLMDEQLPRALQLRPELALIMIGANDLAKRGADPAALAATLEIGVETLREAGIEVLLVNCFDPAFAFLRSLRTKAAIFNNQLWSMAARHGATVVDFWGAPELRRHDHWAEDRVHLSSRGHRALAYRAAAALGLPGAAELGSLDAALHDDPLAPAQRQVSNRVWLWRHVRPWAVRRLRGRTAGDGLVSKHSDYVAVPSKGVAGPSLAERAAGAHLETAVVEQRSAGAHLETR